MSDAVPAVPIDFLGDPPSTEPATHTVLSTLREKILTGEIAPGARLRAEALATEMNVSRTPIRSALAVLSAEGIVQYSVNRGYTVRSVTIGDILAAVEVRAALEGTAARMSVDLGWTPGDLARLQDCAIKGREIADRGVWSEQIEFEWYELNWIFHRTINIAARNPVLRTAMRMTILSPVSGDVIHTSPVVAAHVPQRLRKIPDTTPDHVVRSQADHEAILAAILADDGGLAERLMTAHVLATKARVHALATLR
ncbi:MAG: GntR family transcriptional regulator [Alphaproteobacteria bacterium]|nr:GntR family transcriptional regulator [Alphaproteobacteria bacterium]MBU2379544.1 GntR family transcriptional regulator [Alphaproteobacteria bacterium]